MAGARVGLLPIPEGDGENVGFAWHLGINWTDASGCGGGSDPRDAIQHTNTTTKREEMEAVN